MSVLTELGLVHEGIATEKELQRAVETAAAELIGLLQQLGRAHPTRHTSTALTDAQKLGALIDARELFEYQVL